VRFSADRFGRYCVSSNLYPSSPEGFRIERPDFEIRTISSGLFIAEVERRSAPMAVPWVRMMLCYAKALLASPARAEAPFQDGLDTIAQNWPAIVGLR
jgi:hypothetical protein